MKKVLTGLALFAVLMGCLFAGNVSKSEAQIAGDRWGGLIAGDRWGGLIA